MSATKHSSRNDDVEPDEHLQVPLEDLDLDMTDESFEYGNTPPRTGRYMKKSKAATRKTGAHRSSRPRKSTGEPADFISAGSGGDVVSRRHTISMSESKAMDKKKRRDAKLAERQRYTFADLTSLADLSPLVNVEENIGGDKTDKTDRLTAETDSQKTSTSSSRRGSFKSDCSGQEVAVGVGDEEQKSVVPSRDQLDARADFFKTFSLLINLGTQKQRQKEQVFGSRGGIAQRHMSQPVLSVSSPKHQEHTDTLWLELQAFLDGRPLEDQMMFLEQARFQVSLVLSDIMSFTVRNPPRVPSNASAFVPRSQSVKTGDHHAGSEQTIPTVSITSGQCDQVVLSVDPKESLLVRSINLQGNSVQDDLVLDNAIVQPRSADDPCSASWSSQSVPSTTDSCHLSTAAAANRLTSPPIDMPQSKTQGPSKQTVSRQRRLSERSTESQDTDSISPFSSSNFQSFTSVDSLFPDPASCITPEQLEALASVELVMNRLENTQSYYPNLSALAKDYPLYETDPFDRRLKALNLWYNVMKDLHHKIKLMTTWTDVRVDLRPFSMKTRFLRMQAARRFSLQPSRPRSVTVRQTRIQSESLLDDTAAPYYHAMSLPPELLSRQAQAAKLLESDAVAAAFESDRDLLEHLFPSMDVSVEEGVTCRYRKFVDKSLKQMGLSKLMSRLSKCLHRTLKRAHNTLACEDPGKTVSFEEQMPSMMDETLASSPLSPPPRGFVIPMKHQQRSQKRRRNSCSKRSVAGLTQEFTKMGLPSFKLPFLRLLCVSVDVIHECMRFRLDHKPQKEPSALSIQQLIAEYKECMLAAVQQKQYFVKMLAGVVALDGGSMTNEILESEKDEFEADLKETLEVYFDYLLSYVTMLQDTTQASKSLKNILEQEWQFVKEIAPHIRGAEAEAGRKFCVMASGLLDSTGDFLGSGLDNCCSSTMCDSSASSEDTALLMFKRRHSSIDICRQCKQLFYKARERASKALGFAKMLRKDLEIAADFACRVPISQLLQDLKALDHVEVKIPLVTGYMIFVPHSLKDRSNHIMQLLNVTCGREETSGTGMQMNDGYMLFLSIPGSPQSSAATFLGTASPPATEASGENWPALEWTGPVIEIVPDIETTIGLSELQVGQLKLIVCNSSLLLSERKYFQRAIGPSVALIQEQTSSHGDVAEHLNELKESALRLGEQVLKAVSRVDHFLQLDLAGLDESERIHVHQQYVEAMLSCFNFGFEYEKEVSRLVNGEQRDAMVPQLIEFAMRWMDFVIAKCERGRGTRPRWATSGLEFLIVVGELSMSSKNMTETQYQVLKGKMNECISHVIGSPTDQPASFHGWRSNSPSPLGSGDRRLRIPSPRGPLVGSFRTRLPLGSRSASVPAVPLIVTSDLASTDTSVSSGSTSFCRVHNTIEDRDEDNASPPNSDSSTSSGVQANDSPPMSTAQNVAVGCTPVKSASDTSIDVKTPTPQKLGLNRSVSAASNISSSAFSMCSEASTPGLLASSDKVGVVRQGRRLDMMQERLKQFDMDRNKKLQEHKIIGRVSNRKADSNSDVVGTRVRHVNFPWQRGRKIGEGRFGKVYACINMETGDLMAVKEVRFQGSPHSAIKDIVDEIKILEGISHPNVVRYYGVEVHKEEMFIFMEYCGDGTIWHVAKQGLPEAMIRWYTCQILVAIEVLHRNGIVHRDIKGANIFLSSDGLIKLGDFGCSVKLQNLNTTMPGEINTTRGTVAYMAPEVITSDPSVGSGRAADIWSLGCVVIEMATGKRPWPEYDHEYSIMFQVGSGNSPKTPDRLSEEGKNFLKRCFNHEPHIRSTASELLDHPFVKIGAPDLQIN